VLGICWNLVRILVYWSIQANKYVYFLDNIQCYRWWFVSRWYCNRPYIVVS
jgi:hypothetical protein